VAPEFLATLYREAALKDSIAKAQGEIAEAEKRIQAMRTSLRNVHVDLHRATTGIEKLDAQFAERRRVDPVLAYVITTANKASHVFRASLTKTLPPTPEDSQVLMWAKPALVEVEADSPNEARRMALRQFPGEHGYAVGDFQEIRRLATEAAA
jgi:hypothetical protein